MAAGSIRNLMVRLGVEVDSSTERNVNTFRDNMVKLGSVIGGAFAVDKIVEFGKAAFAEAQDAYKIGKLTEAVIKSTGGAAKVTSDHIGDLAEAISLKSGIDDEAIQSGENLLLTFTNIRNETGKGNKIFDQATQAATDMSVALGKDLNGSAIMVGKALNDPLKGLTALSKAGVSFTAEQKEQIKGFVAAGNVMGAQKIILGELTKEFGGAAAAAATPADKARVAWGNFQEQIGTKLMPVVNRLLDFLTTQGIPALARFADFVEKNGKQILIVAGAITVGVAAWKAYTLAVQVAAVTSAVVAGLGRGVALLSGLWDTLRLKAMFASDAIKSAGGPMNALKTSIGSVGGVVGKAKGALSGIGSMLATGGPWGIAIGGAIAAVMYFASQNDEAEARVSGLTDAIKEDSGVLGTNTRAKIVNTLQTQGLLDMAQKAGINAQLFTDAVMGQGDAMQRVDAILQQSAKSVTTYGVRGAETTSTTKELTGVSKLLFDGLHGGNAELTEAQRKQRQLSDAMGSTKATGTDAAEVIGEVGNQAHTTAGKVRDLNKGLGLFKSITADADEAGIDFKNTIDEMSSAFRKNGLAIDRRTGSFNLNTKTGRANNSMLIDAIRKAGEHADKVYKETTSVKKANATFNDEIRVLRGVIDKHGGSRTSLDKLINKYIDAKNRINKATSGIKDRKVMIGVYGANKLIGFHVSVKGSGGTVLNADGGILPGYTPGRDPHMFYSPTGGAIGLSGGEAVLRPEFTRVLGSEWVNKGNKAAKSGGVAGVAKVLGVAGDPGGLGIPGYPGPHGNRVGFAGGGIIAASKISGIGSIEKGAAEANRNYASWVNALGKAISKELNTIVGGVGGNAAVKAARSQIGVPYSWGGGGPGGPSRGIAQGANTIGFDCSGLMEYAWYKAIHKSIGGTTYAQKGILKRISGPKAGAVGQPHPGHTYMASGKGTIIEAQQTGTRIHERPMRATPWWGWPPWKMDEGGVMTPGSMAVNMTRKPEAVFTKKQWETGGANKGGDTINIHVHASPGTDKAALGKEIYELLAEYKRRSKRGGSLL